MSDQDFFFDEDEKVDEEVAEKPARNQASGRPAPRQSASRQSAAGYGGQSVTMTVAALIGVVALLVGVIIGILIPAGGATTSPTASSATSVSAPQLTDEQIQSGVMPEGHPSVSDMATATPDATATP